jgi:DNA-binding Lrp family transcriptional regulator
MSLVTAVVLMEVERGKVDALAQQLLQLEGVSEVFSVAGQYDLVAVLRTRTNEQIADLVTTKIRDLPNIVRTQTLMAFKAFARGDLDRMFNIGAE